MPAPHASVPCSTQIWQAALEREVASALTAQRDVERAATELRGDLRATAEQASAIT